MIVKQDRDDLSVGTDIVRYMTFLITGEASFQSLVVVHVTVHAGGGHVTGEIAGRFRFVESHFIHWVAVGL